MIKHIIVEGVDGSGKTTLRDRLLEALPGFVPHPRASDSIDGPVKALDYWVAGNSVNMPNLPPSIYDRHPIISEPIYGPVCRGKVPGMFNQPTWVDMMRHRVAPHALVVFCNPPYRVVKDNVLASKNNQMRGVVPNILRLYSEYKVSVNNWPGIQIRYDYTRMSFQTLLHYVNIVTGDKPNGNR